MLSGIYMFVFHLSEICKVFINVLKWISFLEDETFWCAKFVCDPIIRIISHQSCFEKNTWSDAFQVKLQLALCLQGPMRPLFVLESAMVFVVFFWPHSLMITNMSDCPLWRFDATGWPNQIGWKSAQSGVHCQLPRMSCKPGPCMPFVWLSILAHGLEWQLWCQLNNLYFSDSGTTPQMLTFWGCVRFSRCQSLCLWKKL